MSLKYRFREAAENVKRLKQLPNEDELLEIYSLYKQAELGDCNIPKPGLMDFRGKTKWEAWNSRRGLDREEAMTLYIERVENLIKKYGIN